MIFVHSEWGKGGTCDELMTDSFANLRSRAKILRSLSVFLRLPSSWMSDNCSWTTHGKSVSSCFCLFPAPSAHLGEAAHFDLREVTSSILGFLGSWSPPAYLILRSCCLSMER